MDSPQDLCPCPKVVTLLLDADTLAIESMDPLLEQMLGYSFAELQAGGLALIRELLPSEDLPALLQAGREGLEACLKGTGPTPAIALRIRRRDGEWKLVHVWGTVVHTKSGGPHGHVLAYVHDMDACQTHLECARREAEERVRLSENRYRTIFEHSGLAMMFVETDGTISLCNKAFEAIMECPREEIEGRLTWMDFVGDPQDLARMKDYHQRRRTGEQALPPTYEFLLRSAKGTLKPVSVNVAMVPGTGQSLVAIRDETERHRVARALEDSRTLYRAIFENTGNASILVEEDTTILLANSEWERVSGYSRAELEGKMSWTQFIVPEDLERMKGYHRIRRIDPEGAPWTYEFRFLRRNGEILDMVNRVAMIPGTKRSIASFMDISARKRAEAERGQLQERLSQAEKLEAIGQLAGGVAHDFNNQLNAIMGFAELLEMNLQDPELRGHAQLIAKSCMQAGDLTKNLLAFARKGKFLSVPVDIHRVVADVATLLQRSIDRRIEVLQRLTASPSTVVGDPSQLQSALMNLAINARDAMPEGGTLSFTTALCSLDEAGCQEEPFEIEPGTFLRISVEDTGIGMDAETRRRIFEPFFTTKGLGKGTGLGLASVYGTVKQHRGAIRVHSEPGKGSRFEVFIPMTQEKPQAPHAPVAMESAGPARILVADDEELVTACVAGLHKNLGYRVDVCRDGAEAVNFYSRHWRDIELVILDLIMPRVGGKDAFNAMRLLNPKVKVIIASGFSVEGEAQSILDAGAKAFIQKPFQGTELASLVKSVLQG